MSVLLAGIEAWGPTEWGELVVGTGLIVGAIWQAAAANTKLSALLNWSKSIDKQIRRLDKHETQIAVIKARIGMSRDREDVDDEDDNGHEDRR
jgi:hypothetical protein